MAVLVTDPKLEGQLRAAREESGAGGFDEVWDGVYVMAPLADDEHQDLQTAFGAVFKTAVGWGGLGQVRTGVNVSDREAGWEHNNRVPDVAVFLPGGRARNCGTHWCGGPDLAVEIVSPFDRTREKFSFYEQVGVRELLLVDRQPWGLELYRLASGRFVHAGTSTPSTPAVLASSILPLTFQIVQAAPRPQIQVTVSDGSQRWLL